MRRGIRNMVNEMKTVLRMNCVVLIISPYAPGTLVAMSQKKGWIWYSPGGRWQRVGVVMTFVVPNGTWLTTVRA